MDALNTYIFSSQACENTLRIARALSGPYSSISNFSVKSFIKKCEKISIINSIKTSGGQTNKYYRFKFPQHHKIDKEISNHSISSSKQLNLTESDIETIIQNAFQLAKKYIAIVNMTKLLINKNIYSLPELSRYIKINISKLSSKVIDYKEGINFDEDSDEDESHDEDDSEVSDNQDQLSSNSTDNEDDEGCVLASDLSDAERQSFHGCRIYDKVNPKQVNKYFRVCIGTSSKLLHKQTASRLLTDIRHRLLSDRVIRVQKSGK